MLHHEVGRRRVVLFRALACTLGLLGAALVAQTSPALAQEPAPAGANKAARGEPEHISLYGMLLSNTTQDKLVVASVSPASPAAVGGVREGDVLVEVAGYTPVSLADLGAFAKTALVKQAAGEEVPFVFRRADARVRLTIVAPEPAPPTPQPKDAPPPVVVQDEIIYCMTVNDGEGYLLVKDVMKDSPAWLGGVRPGDIITAVGGQPVTTSLEFSALIGKQKQGDKVMFRVLRAGKSLEGAVVMAPCEVAQPAAAPTTDLAGLAAQVKLLQAQIEELRRTAQTLQASLEVMQQNAQR